MSARREISCLQTHVAGGYSSKEILAFIAGGNTCLRNAKGGLKPQHVLMPPEVMTTNEGNMVNK